MFINELAELSLQRIHGFKQTEAYFIFIENTCTRHWVLDYRRAEGISAALNKPGMMLKLNARTRKLPPLTKSSANTTPNDRDINDEARRRILIPDRSQRLMDAIAESSHRPSAENSIWILACLRAMNW